MLKQTDFNEQEMKRFRGVQRLACRKEETA